MKDGRAVIGKEPENDMDVVNKGYLDNIVLNKASTAGLEYTLSDDGTYYICSGIGTATDTEIVIASVCEGLPVKEIGDSAFRDCSNLTSITIPDSVISIGGYAFAVCSSLESVTIGDSVTSIGDAAFVKCTSLTSITIPDSVTSIGNWVFQDCTSLTSISIPDGVTSIGGSTFYRCSSLASITIGYGVPSIGDYAFRECTSLTSITIPDSVTRIGYEAFSGCSSLESVYFGKNSQLTSIGNSAFKSCYNLTSINIPDSVTNIGSAFANSGISSITIPDNVTSIGSQAFLYCPNLASITVGKGVTNIVEGAFESCNNLKTVINYSSLQFTSGSDDYGGIAKYAETILVPSTRWSEERQVFLENDKPIDVQEKLYNPNNKPTDPYWGVPTVAKGTSNVSYLKLTTGVGKDFIPLRDSNGNLNAPTVDNIPNTGNFFASVDKVSQLLNTAMAGFGYIEAREYSAGTTAYIGKEEYGMFVMFGKDVTVSYTANSDEAPNVSLTKDIHFIWKAKGTSGNNWVQHIGVTTSSSILGTSLKRYEVQLTSNVTVKNGTEAGLRIYAMRMRSPE